MDSRVELRLPGLGHSLWISGLQSTARAAVSLPGDGFSLWGNGTAPASVRLVGTAYQLPGDGLSVWIDESFAQASNLLVALTEQGAGGTKGLVLPGDGHSLWQASDLVPQPATLVSAETSLAEAQIVTLPGEGFSLWTHPDRASVAPPPPQIRLPGDSYCLWTKPFLQPSGYLDRPFISESPLYPESTHQPSLIARTMKLFGIAQWIGVFLILALLFGFLGSRQEADNLKADLSASETALVATKKQRQSYLDQVNELTVNVAAAKKEGEGYLKLANALEGKIEVAVQKEIELKNNVDALTKAKAGIENTLNTQIANLEKANQAADEAKAEVAAKLSEVEKAGAAKEAELSGVIEEMRRELGESEEEATALKGSIAELTKANETIGAQLEENVAALKQAEAEAQSLKSLLDQSEKSKSELEKKVGELEKALEAKEDDEAAADAEEA